MKIQDNNNAISINQERRIRAAFDTQDWSIDDEIKYAVLPGRKVYHHIDRSTLTGNRWRAGLTLCKVQFGFREAVYSSKRRLCYHCQYREMINR